MNTDKQSFNLDYKSQNILFISMIAFFILGALLMSLKSNKEIFLILNGDQGVFIDQFFRYATYLGDGNFLLRSFFILFIVHQVLVMRLTLLFLQVFLPSSFSQGSA